MRARYFPWLDRAGRLSVLKLAVFVALFVPGAVIELGVALGWLAPKPITEAIHGTGEWAVRFLVLSLLVSPLRRVGHWGKLVAVRRMLGLAALAYGLVHLTLYVVDQKFDLSHVASEIVLRFYLTIGFVALLGLVALGVTSTDGMVRRLGAKAWGRLHLGVYGIGVLALIHYLLQSKLDVTDAMVMVGFFLLLMGQRLLARFGRGDGIVALAGLAVGSALAAALAEAAWYWGRNHIAPAQVLAANLDFDSPLRPAWLVLFAGLALLLVRVARPLWDRRKPPARSRPPEGRASRLAEAPPAAV